MKLQVSIAGLIVCLSSAVAQAQEVDLSLSDDTVLARYVMPLSYSGYGRTDAEFGVMYTESDNFLMSAGLSMIGEVGSHAPGLQGGVSIKAYGVSLDGGADVGALTMGGKLWFVPPAMSRAGLIAQLNFGPDITTFGDAKRFWDFRARAEYEVLPEAAVYVGYRKVRATLENSVDVDLDKGWHVGLRMSF